MFTVSDEFIILPAGTFTVYIYDYEMCLLWLNWCVWWMIQGDYNWGFITAAKEAIW